MSLPSFARVPFAVVAFAVLAASVSAQTSAVIDPRIVEFDPSPDHAISGTNGPLVTRYDLELYLVDGTQPVQVANLGKPTPQTDGKIRVDFTSLLTPWPAAGTVYEARVAAVGPAGVGRSAESNTFSFSSPCSSSVSPTSVSVASAASTGSVAVSAVTGCAWSATSGASWLTITAGAAGSGNGTVAYSVAANPTTTQRSGSLSIAGHTFTITQSGSCGYTITPSATSVSAGAATGSVGVTTSAGCTWTASSAVSWITITSGASGTASGAVAYSVAANTGSGSRTGTMTIAGRTFTVTQEGVACAFVLAPVGATLGANAAAATVAVTAASGCAWTASSSASWITITSGATGSGNGQVSYSVSANPGTSSRSGTITIGGQAFNVTQSGQACTYAITPTSTSVPAGATSGSVSVQSLAGCSWTAAASASWISITSTPTGSGNGTVAFTVAANSALAARSGTVSVGGETFTINQAGVVCSAAIAPVSASVGASGLQGSVLVTLPSACAWTASGSTSWLTITSGSSGTGSGSVNYSVAANASTSARNGTLTIAGQTFTVSQAGITCSYAVTPTTAAAIAAAGTGSVGVTSAAGCAWTASSSVSWITITGGATGAGPGSVSYAFTANPTTLPRTGALTVAGQPVTVTQAAGCGYGISPASASLSATAGSGTVTVTAGTGCAWSAQSPESWITLGTPSTPAGNGTVTYLVAANPNSSSRSTTITVAGQPFVITQAGASCDATLNPTTQNISAAGGDGSVSISVPGGCAWSSVPSVSWISVLTGASGTGNGSITYRVDANPTGTTRNGTLAIGGRLLNIAQGAASCTASVSSTTESFEAAGGSRVVSVTIPSGCVWIALSNTTWITVTSGGGPNSSGNGGVTFLVAPNASSSPRTGTLTVSGRTVTVEQAGTCDIAISPNTVSTSDDAASGSVSVSTGASCTWSASSSASWLTITSGGSGTGAGTLVYSTAANTTNAVRTGTMTIGGRVFSVTQAAPGCALVLSTTSLSLTSAPAFRTVQVNTGTTCAWTATSTVPWITVAVGSTGTGAGSISYNVTANTGTATRTGTVVIGGESLTITQTGAACTLNLAPTSITLSGAGTTGSVAVDASAGCPWTSSSNVGWLTITSGASGDGDGAVQYSVSPNPTAFTRFGALTIGGRGFNVTQSGNSCTTTLSSLGVSIGPAASNVSVNVTAGGDCTWAAASSASWIAVTGGASGAGSGAVTLSVLENTTSTTRSGMVSIAGRSFMVTQSGACDYSVSPTSVSVGGGSSSAFIWVMTGTGCGWTAQSPVPWVTLSSASGSGGGTVTVLVAANTTTSPRSTTLTIADRPVVVTQAGVPCNYTVTPLSMNVGGGSQTVTVTAPAGCAWNASSSVAWMSFPNASSGSGSGSVVVQLAANTSPITRFGSISVAGWRIFVTQRVSTATAPAAPGGMRIVVD